MSAARKQRAPKPLASLYAAPETDSHNETVKAMTGTPDRHREQETYTPTVIGDFLDALWGEVALDPCWGPGSVIPAKERYYVPKRLIMGSDGEVKESFDPGPHDTDGLSLSWLNHTFFNPPYKHPDLSKWLKKAMEEAEKGFEIVGLVPARGHRYWFREATKHATRVADLDPLRFLGHKSAFPAPLCLLYWGWCPKLFEYWLEEFKLGECRK